jgi:hypothetical protein
LGRPSKFKKGTARSTVPVVLPNEAALVEMDLVALQ